MPEIEIAAGTIHYEDTGGDGPVVVLLHGLIMDHTQWRKVLPELGDYRCVLPTLPLGAHRTPMKPGTDLTLPGQVRIVADFLDALELRDVTLVCTDWGGGMLLTHFGRDDRVARLVLCPCEAFDNYPPGLPGKMALIAARMPGGITLALRQLRIGWLRRSRLLFGWMAKRPLDDELVHGWTAPGLASKAVRSDLRAYATSPLVDSELIEMTESLERFSGPALVVWASEDKVMPREHGRRLADLLPNGRLVEVPDSYVLMQEDQPELLARHLREFLTETSVRAAA
ncbi:MAG TPA: alpha/beta hydrolase [Thermoleophilaceae bacterium]